MKTRTGSWLVSALLLFAAAPLDAQRGTPDGWKWVTDRPAPVVGEGEMPDGGWHFVEMAPGWHITMGPGGIVYRPNPVVEGRFVLEAEIFLFPQPTRAGYGVVAGVSGIEGGAPSYLAFLARPDGSIGVVHHAGSEVHTLVDWTRHDAVRARAEDGPVKNVFRVEGEPDSLRFLVNGQRVATLPRPGNLDGPVGLRIGEGVNLHVSNFDITRRMAPTPVGRR